jgi:hypothetical protein
MSCRRGCHSIYPTARQYGKMRMVGQRGRDADGAQEGDSSRQSIYMQSINQSINQFAEARTSQSDGRREIAERWLAGLLFCRSLDCQVGGVRRSSLALAVSRVASRVRSQQNLFVSECKQIAAHVAACSLLHLSNPPTYSAFSFLSHCCIHRPSPVRVSFAAPHPRSLALRHHHVRSPSPSHTSHLIRTGTPRPAPLSLSIVTST